MIASLSVLDLVFLVITSIFIFTAILRGFIGEIFSIISMVVVTIAVLNIPQIIRPFFENFSNNSIVLDTVSVASVFVITSVAARIVSSSLRRSVSFFVPAAIDYPLGVTFALAKSLLLFGLVYSVSVNVFTTLSQQNSAKVTADLPEWFTEAKSANIIRLSGNLLDPLVKKFLKDFFEGPIGKNLDSDILNQKIDEIRDNTGIDVPNLEDIDIDQSDIDKIDEDAVNGMIKKFGYDKKDLENLDRLIEIVN